MDVKFEPAKVRGYWRITSPLIPGWSCSARTKDAAFARVQRSLRCYLRYTDNLDPWTRRQLKILIIE
jgi:hypothetical protein